MPKLEQILAPNEISYDYNNPDWIVVHYTATDASAYNNAVYFSRGGNWNSSAHYFLDGGGVIYQSVPDDRGAWACGNYEANTNSISIEVVSSGQDFDEAEIAELQWLVHELMKQYDIPASHVIRHYDVADVFGGYTLDPNKHCPAPYVDNSKWSALKKRITSTAKKEDELKPVTNDGGAVYRLYNPNTGFHHYTLSAAEKDALMSSGWKFEGEAWKARASQRLAVYRMYNPGNGDHVLTKSYSEAESLSKAGWNYEGVPFFAADSGTAVYRVYNPNSGEHFYTTSDKEATDLSVAGWRREGVAFNV